MAGVFQNTVLTPHPPHRQRVCSVPFVRGEDTLARRRGGWGFNILEDVRNSSVLYVCKYFVVLTFKIKSRLCVQLPQSEEVSPSSCNTDKLTPSPGPEPKNKFSWPTLKQMKQIFLVDQSRLETKIILSVFAKKCKFDKVLTKNAKCSLIIRLKYFHENSTNFCFHHDTIFLFNNYYRKRTT